MSWAPGGGHLWKRPTDGNGPPQMLTRVPAFYRDPVWSPDGTRSSSSAPLAARRRRTPWSSAPSPGPTSSGCPPPAGETQLIIPARGASRPHFGPEPDRVYVTTPAGLVSMRFDGTDRRTHLKVVGKKGLFGDEPDPADVILLRPDGSWALALVTNQVYLLALPRFGGEAPKVDVDASPVPLEEAHRHRRRRSRLGRRRQDDHLGGRARACSASLSSSVNFEAAQAGRRTRRTAPTPPRRTNIPKAEEIAVIIERPRGTAPRDRSSSRGAKIVTMRGDEVIAEGDVVVTDHRIKAVGPNGQGQCPRGGQDHRRQGHHDRHPASSTPMPHWTEIRRACSTSRTGASSPTSPTA